MGHTMDPVKQSLQWYLLLDAASQIALLPETKTCFLEDRLPSFDTTTSLLDHWGVLDSLSPLAHSGALPLVALGALEDEPRDLSSLWEGTQKGRVLMGEDFRGIALVLRTLGAVVLFAKNNPGPYLNSLAQLRTEAQLLKDIQQAIGPEGEVLDRASPELAQIRKEKKTLTYRIEQKLKSFIHHGEGREYLQDDLFSVRAGGVYVVPVGLDSKGRIPGSIVDTSTRGQTLWVAPSFLDEPNTKLQNLDVDERREVFRILKKLSLAVGAAKSVLDEGVEALKEFDYLTTLTLLGHRMGGVALTLRDTPGLDLRRAHHPFLALEGKESIPNTIELREGKERLLVISGPNGGGKTVVLKTVGLIHLMAKSGMLLPVCPSSTLYLFPQILLAIGDSQDLTAQLSTFSGHVRHLKAILDQAGPGSLVLLDELATGTESQTGAALAQAVLEALGQKHATVIASTHFDSLKTLPYSQPIFRNASMEYALKDWKPTYRLTLDLPGQSYGLEVAFQNGLDPSIINRARSLRPEGTNTLEGILLELQEIKEAVAQEKKNLETEKEAALATKARWDQEIDLLKQNKKELLSRLKESYEEKFQTLKKTWNHGLSTPERAQAQTQVHAFLEELSPPPVIPKKIDHQVDSPFSPGDRVLTNGLGGGEARILKISGKKADIQTKGGLRLQLPLADLKRAPGKPSLPTSKPREKKTRGQFVPTFLMSTSTNTLDIRGRTLDEALFAMWRFIDRAIDAGEMGAVIIHGHGEDRLKNGLRDSLKTEDPYGLRFEPAPREQGGDGVTWVFF
jgi:DNA mismatch repair protein MutS2